MNNTAITEYCPECGDEFKMVCTTIWVNGKRLHEDCQRRATFAAKDAEIARLRRALYEADEGCRFVDLYREYDVRLRRG